MSIHDYTSGADIDELMNPTDVPMFTMSMYATREDLYKAKAEYYRVQIKVLAQLLCDCHQPAADTRDWKLVDRINVAMTMLEEI